MQIVGVLVRRGLDCRRRSRSRRPKDEGCRGAGFSACRLPARLSASGADCTGAPMKSQPTTRGVAACCVRASPVA